MPCPLSGVHPKIAWLYLTTAWCYSIAYYYSIAVHHSYTTV